MTGNFLYFCEFFFGNHVKKKWFQLFAENPIIVNSFSQRQLNQVMVVTTAILLPLDQLDVGKNCWLVVSFKFGLKN